MKKAKRSPRVEWVESQVRQRYPTASILDVGFVGRQREPDLHMNLRRQNPRSHIAGIDIDIEGVLKWRLSNTLAADGYNLPFKDASFQAVSGGWLGNGDYILCLSPWEL